METTIRTCEHCDKQYIGSPPLCLDCRAPQPITTKVAVLRECSLCGRDTFAPDLCVTCALQEYGEPEPIEREWQDIAADDAGVKRWGEL